MSYAPLAALLITALVALTTLHNWRYGLLCIIGIGVLQDVLRKLTPAVPSYYLLWSMLMFMGVAVVAIARNELGSIRRLWFRDTQLESAFLLYLLLVLLHVVHSLVRWGSPVMPVFGLIFYLGPLLALWLVMAFARQPGWMERFIATYLCIMVPVSLTIYLSLLFHESIPVLRDVGSFLGQQLIIYDVGTILYSYPGLLRVGEIAAFHAAACAALLSMLLYQRNTARFKQLAYLALIVLLVGAIVLTGRRKMLMALSIFWVLQFVLLGVLRRGFTKRLLLVAALGLTFAVGIEVMSEGDSSALYLERGTSVFGEVGARVDTSLMLFQSALGRSSWLGLGAGTASQGMRYTGIDMLRFVGGSSESGVGYIAVELGLPGIVVIAWLVWHLTRVLWKMLKRLAKAGDHNFLQAVTYTAFLVANLATFVTATQLYGDYFVLIVLGVFAGGLYAAIHNGVKKQLLLTYLLVQDREELEHVRG